VICRINIEQFAKFWNDKANGHDMRCRLSFVRMQQRAQRSQTFEKLPSELQGQSLNFNLVHPEDARKGLAATFGGYVITGACAHGMVSAFFIVLSSKLHW